MRTVLALAFLALAQATHYDNVIPPVHVAPAAAKAMFLKYGLEKPAFDSNFASFARSVAQDAPVAGHLHALYDQPALLLFADPANNVVSYYADAGVHSALQIPAVRAVLPSVAGAADSMAIVYQPESLLGAYKSVLPGRFFAPSMRSGEALPMPAGHAYFKKAEIPFVYPEAAPVYAKFNIDKFPLAYKSPVNLRLVDDETAIPSSSFKSSPYAACPHRYPPYKSYTPALRSEIPSYQAYIPDLKFPLYKQLAAYEPAYKATPYSTLVTPAASVSSASIVAPVSSAYTLEPASAEAKFISPFSQNYAEPSAKLVSSAYPAPAIRYAPFSSAASFAPAAAASIFEPTSAEAKFISPFIQNYAEPSAKMVSSFYPAPAIRYAPFAPAATVAPAAAASTFEPASAEAKIFSPFIQNYAEPSAKMVSSFYPAPAIRYAPFAPAATVAPTPAASIFEPASAEAKSFSPFIQNYAEPSDKLVSSYYPAPAIRYAPFAPAASFAPAAAASIFEPASAEAKSFSPYIQSYAEPSIKIVSSAYPAPATRYTPFISAPFVSSQFVAGASPAPFASTATLAEAEIAYY